MRISDWSSDVCSSDLLIGTDILRRDDRAERFDGARTAHEAARIRQFPAAARDRARAVRRQHRRQHTAGALIDGDIAEDDGRPTGIDGRTEEHTSELQSLMLISYAVICLKKKRPNTTELQHTTIETAK